MEHSASVDAVIITIGSIIFVIKWIIHRVQDSTVMTELPSAKIPLQSHQEASFFLKLILVS